MGVYFYVFFARTMPIWIHFSLCCMSDTTTFRTNPRRFTEGIITAPSWTRRSYLSADSRFLFWNKEKKIFPRPCQMCRERWKNTPSGQNPFLCPPRNWHLVHPGPLSENFIFSPSRVTSFFDFYNVLALIIPYFACILPFYFPYSLFLSPFFLFLVHFPLSSLPLLIFFSPKWHWLIFPLPPGKVGIFIYIDPWVHREIVQKRTY